MRTVVSLLLAAVLVAGCGSSGNDASTGNAGASSGDAGLRVTSTSSTTPVTSDPASSSAAARSGTLVTTAASPFGTVLFDRTGQAIYTFDAETSGKPTCYSDCARAWPPVLTTDPPVAASGVRQDLLGTTSRSDGSTQVTYRGKPLYFYAHEGKHQVLCHNVREYGGLWLAVTPAGGPAPT